MTAVLPQSVPRPAQRRGGLGRSVGKALAMAAPLAAAFVAYDFFASPERHYRRALQAIDANDLEPVAYELLSLEHLPAYEAQASLLSTKLLLARGQPELAIPDATVAAADPATKVRGMVLMGECLYKTNEPVLAGESWMAALKLDPENVDAYRWLGAAYYDLGAAEMARGALQKAAELDRKDPGPHRLIGHLCSENSDTQGAIDAYREALRRAPERRDNDEIRLRLADALHRAHQDADALAVLAECASSAEVLAYQAECQFSLDCGEIAWQSLERSLKADPHLVRALGLKGKMLLKERKYNDAVKTLEAAARLASTDMTVLYDLAIAYHRLGDMDKAQAAERRFAAVSELEREYAELRVAARGDLDDAQVRCKLGIVAAKLEKFSLARKWLEMAVGLDPENVDAQVALQRLKWPAQMDLRRD